MRRSRYFELKMSRCFNHAPADQRRGSTGWDGRSPSVGVVLYFYFFTYFTIVALPMISGLGLGRNGIGHSLTNETVLGHGVGEGCFVV